MGELSIAGRRSGFQRPSMCYEDKLLSSIPGTGKSTHPMPFSNVTSCPLVSLREPEGVLTEHCAWRNQVCSVAATVVSVYTPIQFMFDLLVW